MLKLLNIITNLFKLSSSMKRPTAAAHALRANATAAYNRAQNAFIIT